MSKVFIIGAAGKIGRHLISKLAERGHQPMALHRNPEQAADLNDLGGTSVIGDLLELDAAALARLMADSDAVVFSAGAGGKGGMEMTNAIDGRGLELAVAAAKQAGIRRFLLVSAFPEAGRDKQMPERFENYMKVKKLADVHLAESDLNWIILRPGTLVDEAGAGNVRVGAAIPYGDVARSDVAAVLTELIDTPQVNRIIIELTQGETPVPAAVQRLMQG
ncbi:SDR family oxidoreductase [Pseudomonas sp. FME51]|uniref:SDR family oxidoreductase n=1 Tax=Pseudomonas sp. FME51 TaxID=2742609 RepID=UPI001867457E|nr:SDR family oxidoreductase [Pseudomonas sp. FME51]